MSASPPSPIQLAILDDYQGIAAPRFESLKPRFEITVFRDTLLPYNQAPASVKQELEERLKPFAVISAMRERTPFPADLLDKLPNLKLIVTTGHRNASIDIVACKRLGIKVTGSGAIRHNLPKNQQNSGPDGTTQHTIALILGLARNLAYDDRIVKQGGWQTLTNTNLSGKTFAVLGLGRLGTNVAKIMHQSFGMRIIAWSSSLTQEAADQKAKEAGLPTATRNGERTFLVVSKETLFRDADVLSVHYVLSGRSRGIVSKSDLAYMKSSALFVNTSRGPLVVEHDLLEILEENKIRGAALDVFDLEPLAPESRWRSTEWGRKVLLTPHMGYVDEDTMSNWYQEEVEVIEKWDKGEPLDELK